MGRYPFLEYAMQYMGMRKGFIADSTYDELERKMRYLNKVLVELRASGKIGTTNPKKITRRDIAATSRKDTKGTARPERRGIGDNPQEGE